MRNTSVRHRNFRTACGRSAVLLATLLMQACTDSDGSVAAPGVPAERQALAINLFPGETNHNAAAVTLTLKEAMAQSRVVYRAAGIEKMDSSSAHGAKTFYLYRMTGGARVSDVQTGRRSSPIMKDKFPMLFIASASLFDGEWYDDSVFVFLRPLQDHKLLQLRMHVTYEWLGNAPFGLKGME